MVPMQPTLAAAEVRQNVTQYLATTFALADDDVREGLNDFLNDDAHGIFRGPYLRIRTPFRPADGSWREHLDWAPPGFIPHRHQAAAFQRLSTRNSPAAPTLVTTGTGSGKTESFLVPILDHCRRARARGHRPGVQAVLLYPMNALATDQAQRLDGYLTQEGMAEVTAGLYIGDTPDGASHERLMTQRSEIRRNPPDVLLTNYKMLDLLLQRPEDLPLWESGALRYVVVDEFHTYDGAQGTDVAMLLRRLAAVTGQTRPGAPLGDICPVATSATLRSGPAEDDSEAQALHEVAGTVFGVTFPPESIVTEDRLAVEEFLPREDLDYRLPLPMPHEVANLPDPHEDPEAMADIMAAFTDQRDLSPQKLGEKLKEHILTTAVLKILGGDVRTPPEILDELPQHGAYTWGTAIRATPQTAATALARFVALLSQARDPNEPNRPLLYVETHLWVRSVSRLLRTVNRGRPRFAWHGEATPQLDSDTTGVAPSRGRLPAVYCRHCGRSGWAAISPESEPTALEADPKKIYQASVANKKSVRHLIGASLAEAEGRSPERPVQVLDGSGARVRPVDESDIRAARNNELDGVFVLADLAHTADGFRAATNDRCPACRGDQGTRFLGAGLASLASVVVTEMFTSGQLAQDDDQPKTLLFNDSVQDAAHRAGFVSDRSYTFSLRELVATGLPEDGSAVALHDLIADTVERAGDPEILACVVPLDLQARPEVSQVLEGNEPDKSAVWDMIAERLAFGVIMELGLRSRQGRTLELTRTVAAEVALPNAEQLVQRARELLRMATRQRLDADELHNITPGYLRSLLERIRTRGGITHNWLRPWIGNGGTKRYGALTGNRPDGMRAIPDGMPPPRFLLDRSKEKSAFDSVAGQHTWYQDLTSRALGVEPDTATSFLGKLLQLLHTEGVLARSTTTDGTTQVYGLTPGHIRLRRLDDAASTTAGVRCPTCNWRQTVHPELLGDWLELTCPRYRCSGHLQPDEDPTFRSDYYRHLYRTAEPFRVTTAEHTGQLSRAQREHVERGFRSGTHHTDPNLLSCSPTLELGIDIGELSAVILGSLPAGPANYVQRAGRAGRRSGNAFLATLVGRGARERYYLSDPREMIAGRITPPGSYPSAVEILRRQYAAFLLDRAARGQLGDVGALPRRAKVLFGPTGWLAAFTEAALAAGPHAVEDFLALFDGPGEELDSEVRDELRAFATAGINERVIEAVDTWETLTADLNARVQSLDAAIAGLLDSDPEQRRRKRRLMAERGGLTRRSNERGRTNAHGALVELGLLPNYALIDTRSTLEATITWKDPEPGRDGDVRYHSEVREHERPALRALTEFAPGNYFYARGYRHTIDGLDLGTSTNPAIHTWRVCPDCGFVRTTNARADTSPCPRCRTPRIGDQSAVYDVMEPSRAYARNDRDDALIGDDHDERRRRFHDVHTTVDIPPETIAGSWRHHNESFGVEFSRRAVVRHVNLGEQRMDRVADTRFAGQLVRRNPYHVCRACGGATAGPPSDQQGTINGHGGSQPSHHRPWCPSRRGDDVQHQPVVLAHTLTTEALRILVPVATVQVEQRSVTFKAAFLAGLAAIYGGALDHLDTTIAAMPEHQTEAQRRYLVVYDTLPGGSGYLKPRSVAEGIREILERARDVVATCPCADEGRSACHRCLLDHVSDSEFDLADRQLAIELLDHLLNDWQTEEVSDTSHISLWKQVESELELRFLDGLKAWAAEPGSGRSLSMGGRINERRTGQLHVTSPDGTVIGWDVRLHNTIHHSRPDVVFVRRDTGEQVAVFLDGYSYHASPDKNRLADDATKRARLRAHGITVFQLSWVDMDYWDDAQQVPTHPVWQPYEYTARHDAEQFYQKFGGDSAELSRLLWTSPIDTLLGYLLDPEPQRWRSRVTACVGALRKTTPQQTTTAGAETLGRAVTAALHGEQLPKQSPGKLMVVRGTVTAGLQPVVVANPADSSFSCFVVIDDTPEAVADEEPHKRRWWAWLYWGNLIQFLDTEHSDAAQLVRSELSDFNPEILAQVGGHGWTGSLANTPIPAAERDAVFGDIVDLPRSASPVDVAYPTTPGIEVAPVSDHDAVPAAWQEALELTDGEHSRLGELMHELIRCGAPAPEVGYELDRGHWQAELAWPDQQVAVLLPDQHEGRDHYARAGWVAHDADSWNSAELAQRLTGKEQ